MNRLFISLPISPWKIRLFQLSLNPSLKAVFPWLLTGLSSSVTLKTQWVLLWPSSWPYIPDTKIYRRAKTTRCMPNAMKSWAGVLGERKQQLTGEQSTIPADPFSSSAGNRWCMVLILLPQAWLVPLQYLHVDKCSRAIRCLCLLMGREADVAGQELL